MPKQKDKGRWVTLKGSPVFISAEGAITKGPKALLGLNLNKKLNKSLDKKNYKALNIGGNYGALGGVGGAMLINAKIAKRAGFLDTSSARKLAEAVEDATKVAKKHGLKNVQVQEWYKWYGQFQEKYVKAMSSKSKAGKSIVWLKNILNRQIAKQSQDLYEPISRKIILNSSDEAVYMHELGHAKDMSKSYKQKMMLRALGPLSAIVALYGIATLKDHYEKQPPKTTKERNYSNFINKVWRFRSGVVAMGFAPMLYQEGKATFFALAEMAKKYGWKSKIVKNAAKKLGAAGSTYALLAAGASIGVHWGSKNLVSIIDNVNLGPALNTESKSDLNARARTLGLTPSDYKDKQSLIAAIAGTMSGKKMTGVAIERRKKRNALAVGGIVGGVAGGITGSKIANKIRRKILSDLETSVGRSKRYKDGLTINIAKPYNKKEQELYKTALKKSTKKIALTKAGYAIAGVAVGAGAAYGIRKASKTKAGIRITSAIKKPFIDYMKWSEKQGIKMGEKARRRKLKKLKKGKK